MTGITQSTDDFAFPTIALKIADLLALTAALEAVPCRYLWAGKADWNTDPATIHGLDCSGFVKYSTARVTDGATIWDDGSQEMHAQAKRVGFKLSSIEAAEVHDGYLRIFFLAPVFDEHGEMIEAGHTGYVYNGQTIESHGGVGVGRRDWTGAGWQGRCEVFVLTTPGQAIKL